MPFANNAGVRLWWRSDGDPARAPLLLLNSIGCDLGMWDACVPFLTPWVRVVRMDARGHGASDAPAGEYSLSDLAADATAVLDAAGIGRAHVCGLSLGGMVAMQLALDAPQRIDNLVLACTSPRMDREAWQARRLKVLDEGMAGVVDMALQRFFSDRFRSHRVPEVETVRGVLLSQDPQGYAGCCAAVRDMDLPPRLSEICAPTLVIAGDRDVSTPFDGHGSLIAAEIPQAQVARLDTAHLAAIEAPADFASAVVTFLRPPIEAGADADPAETLYEAGLANRRQVLGHAWVDASLDRRTPFNTDFQAMITRIAWQEIWPRPGLDRRTRRLLVLAITAALGRWEEFRLHCRAGLTRGGFSEGELKEVLMQTAIYAGVPAANTAFAEAAEVIAEVADPGT